MKPSVLWGMVLFLLAMVALAITFRPNAGATNGRPSASNMTAEDAAPFETVSREAIAPSETSDRSTKELWFHDKEALLAFQERVRSWLYDEGKLEQGLRWIDENSRTPLHDQWMADIQEAISELLAQGLIPMDANLYKDLLYGQDAQVRNRVQAELRNHYAWLRDRDSDTFQWPEFEIEHDPFRLTPEMLSAYLSGNKMGVGLGDDARHELSILRDQQLLQMLSLEQELQVLQPAVEGFFRQFQEAHGVQGNSGLSDEEILSLYPETAAIIEAQAELRANYLQSIRNILMSEGIPLE